MRHRKFFLVSILMFVAVACTQTILATALPTPSTFSTHVDPSSTKTITPLSPTMTLALALIPPEVFSTSKKIYDVVSKDTAPEKRAPYGDSYKLNLFERPFNQDMTTYFPNIDIYTFALGSDDNWYFMAVEVVSQINIDASQVNYGVELDLDLDGFGDYLVWVHPAYTQLWSTENVQVLADKNRDSAGITALNSDAPFKGDGYEVLIYAGNTQTEDADVAWVRIDPSNSSRIQFAIKKSLAGKIFMWGVWADGGLKDPTRFSYNDRFSAQEAGSSVRDNEHFPIGVVYLVDSTCRAPFGFEPSGYEPLLCPSNAPIPTKGPNPRPPRAPTSTSPPFTPPPP